MATSEGSDATMTEAHAPTSISAAAHQYQIAMSQQQVVQNPQPADLNSAAPEAVGDISMNGEAPGTVDSPAHATSSTAPSPAPQRTGTPIRKENGPDALSRAASQHPDLAPAIPTDVPLHGAPTRQYLNSKVTGALLEGMKLLAKEQPRDPLKVLGEYLVQRSKDMDMI